MSAPPNRDLYAIASDFVRDLEKALKECNLWPGPKPPGEIQVDGAFGGQNMAFNQWLGWVMIPRVQQIIDTRGTFPRSSSVAAYATREWDGVDSGNVIDVLREFDQAVNAQ